MPTINQAKTMAKRLRDALASRGIDVPHSTTLELVAAELGHDSWNVAAAKLDDTPADGVRFEKTIPLFRSFDEAKAREFYCGFLGFAVKFEHRFEPGLPLYLGLERGGMQIHLSEHHGDASPGATTFVWMRGIRAFAKELNDKKYGFGRPGVEAQPWGDEMQVHDPFGNRIRFCEERSG